MKNHNFLNIFNSKYNKNESSTSFNFGVLMNNVSFKETDTHLYIYNMPSTFGDTQNKNNRIYEQSSLKKATVQFNEVKENNPYFCYLFDGHRDDDSYENIVGRILKLKINEEHKCILADLKLNKGSKPQTTLKNIIKDGDPIGISMRIISPSTVTISREEIEKINSKVIQLEDDDKNIADLMANDYEIEYISGDAYIQRFDLTQFPSFNKAFINKSFKINNESAISKFNNYKKTACLISKNDRCITDSCGFKYTIQDFIKLISQDKSISPINNINNLYDNMMKFCYMNLSDFNFDNVSNYSYLKNKLIEHKMTLGDIKEITEIFNSINQINIINTINKKSNVSFIEYIYSLRNTINNILDVDNIFYQIITLNYVHWAILSTIIINKSYININNINLTIKDIENSISKSDNDLDVIIKLIDDLKNVNTIYDLTNSIFGYFYGCVDNCSYNVAPIAIINEACKKICNFNKNSIFKKKIS